MVEQRAEVAVAGLGGDPFDRGAVERRRGGVPGAKGVPGDGEALEARRVGAVLDESADRSGADAFGGGGSGCVDPGEERRGLRGRTLSQASRAPMGSV